MLLVVLCNHYTKTRRERIENAGNGDNVLTAGGGLVQQIFNRTRALQKGDLYKAEETVDRSGFVRCYYWQSEAITCEKDPGCCQSGCCPKDFFKYVFCT